MAKEFVRKVEGCVSWMQTPGFPGWRNYFNWRLFVNQGWRPAALIAVTGDGHFLFEYEMPSGKTYLTEARLDNDGHFAPRLKGIYKPIPPVRWREEIKDWYGE